MEISIFCDIIPYSPLNSADVSEEQVNASIFRIEEQDKQ
jgi:hypothetical protein